jgi:Flp pilus assembly pilin Flp
MQLETTHTEQNQAAQAMVEYSFILVLVAAVSIAILRSIGGDVAAVFQQIVDGFPGV